VKPLEASLPPGKKPKDQKEKDLFELLHEFLRIVMANADESYKLAELSSLLSVVKNETLRWLRLETKKEIEAMQNDMQTFSNKIIAVVKANTERPYSTRSTQTIQVEQKERSIQCGMTSVSRVEIRKK
jgi:hypothetical protein